MFRNIFVSIGFFLSYTIILYLAWKYGPNMLAERNRNNETVGFAVDEFQRPQWPFSIEKLKLMANHFSKYKNEHMTYMLLMFTLLYLYKQVFAIPGSFFMNVCAGALFGRVLAMVIVCPLTAIGASGCYLLSSFAGRPIIDRFFKQRFDYVKNLVNRNQYRLVYFLVGSRVFPLTPHWLLNIFSPYLDIPLSKHALSVFIGLIPYNLICVEAGEMLSQIHRSSEVLNWKITLELTAVAAGVFAFGYFFKREEIKIHKD